VTFYGISQGGILGSGYALSSPYINKAVLGVPGSPFALVLPRSYNFFSGYFQLLQFQVNRNSHVRLVISLLQVLWDPAEGAGWFSGLSTGNTGSGVDVSKRFLIQTALGDAQVPTLAAQVTARNLNCSTLHPQTRYVSGVAEVHGPVTEGSVYQEFSYMGVLQEPLDNGSTPRPSDSMRGFIFASCRMTGSNARAYVLVPVLQLA